MKRLASLAIFLLIDFLSALMTLGIFMLAFKILPMKQFDSNSNLYDAIILSIISSLINIAFLFIYTKIKTKDKNIGASQVKPMIPIYNYIAIILFTFSAMYFCTITFKESDESILKHFVDNPYIIPVLFFTMISPFLEEVIYRYFFYKLIGKINIFWLVINSLVFALLHYNKANANFGSIFFVFVQSLFLINIPYLVYKSLPLAIFTHITWNSSLFVFEKTQWFRSSWFSYLFFIVGILCLVKIIYDFLKYKNTTLSDFLYSLVEDNEK